MGEYIYRREHVADGVWSAESMGEEIVRCRDCAYFATDDIGEYCTLFDFDDTKGMGNKFCAWGERRNHDEDNG